MYYIGVARTQVATTVHLVQLHLATITVSITVPASCLVCNWNINYCLISHPGYN